MFSIDDSYKTNPVDYFDDIPSNGENQWEVYEYAKKLFPNPSLVVDIGCGNAIKLVRHFNENATIGIDLEPTIKYLLEKYPSRRWYTSDTKIDIGKVDLLICADVIEHVDNPDSFLEYICGFDFTKMVISTPDRTFLVNDWGHDNMGPPKNKCHVREWTQPEFKEYMVSRGFIVENQFRQDKSSSQVMLVRKA